MTISTKLAQEQGGPTKFEINPIDQGRILRPVTAPKRGRPSDYSPEIARTFCYRLIEGESLRRICADAGMPDKATIFRWITRHKEFRDQYALARECQAEALSDESLEIARDSSGDFVKKVLPDGKVVLVPDLANIERARLRISALHWMAGRLAPKKYRYPRR